MILDPCNGNCWDGRFQGPSLRGGGGILRSMWKGGGGGGLVV